MDVFEEEVIGYRQALVKFGTKLSRSVSDGEDLAQSAIMKALMYRHNFELDTNLKSWLFVIIRNEWFTKCRKNNHYSEDPDDVIIHSKPDDVDVDEALDARRALDKIKTLSPRARFILKQVGAGASYHDIGAMLNMPDGTVKSSVFRARQALRQVIDAP